MSWKEESKKGFIILRPSSTRSIIYPIYSNRSSAAETTQSLISTEKSITQFTEPFKNQEQLLKIAKWKRRKDRFCRFHKILGRICTKIMLSSTPNKTS
jgi:hypothetical protein